MGWRWGGTPFVVYFCMKSAPSPSPSPTHIQFPFRPENEVQIRLPCSAERMGVGGELPVLHNPSQHPLHCRHEPTGPK
jgi:hypothetical protein